MANCKKCNSNKFKIAVDYLEVKLPDDIRKLIEVIGKVPKTKTSVSSFACMECNTIYKSKEEVTSLFSKSCPLCGSPLNGTSKEYCDSCTEIVEKYNKLKGRKRGKAATTKVEEVKEEVVQETLIEEPIIPTAPPMQVPQNTIDSMNPNQQLKPLTPLASNQMPNPQPPQPVAPPSPQYTGGVPQYNQPVYNTPVYNQPPAQDFSQTYNGYDGGMDFSNMDIENVSIDLSNMEY